MKEKYSLGEEGTMVSGLVMSLLSLFCNCRVSFIKDFDMDHFGNLTPTTSTLTK